MTLHKEWQSMREYHPLVAGNRVTQQNVIKNWDCSTTSSIRWTSQLERRSVPRYGGFLHCLNRPSRCCYASFRTILLPPPPLARRSTKASVLVTQFAPQALVVLLLYPSSKRTSASCPFLLLPQHVCITCPASWLPASGVRLRLATCRAINRLHRFRDNPSSPAVALSSSPFPLPLPQPSNVKHQASLASNIHSLR